MTNISPHISPTKSLSIAIIGAGIAGLSMAHAIAPFHPNITCKIFERGDKVHRGYAIGVRNTGYEALKVLGLDEEMDAIVQRGANREGVSMQLRDALSDKEWLVLRSREGMHARHGSTQVQRSELRDMLLRTLQEKRNADGSPIVPIEYGRAFSHYEYVPATRQIRVHFVGDEASSDDGIVLVDALIGCDGVRSKVRRQLMHPEIPWEALDTTHFDLQHQLASIVGHSVVSLDLARRYRNNIAMYIGPQEDCLFVADAGLVDEPNRLAWNLSWKTPNPPSYNLEPQELLTMALERTEGWCAQDIIKNTDMTQIRVKNLVDLDVKPVEGAHPVTLAGDAFHAMLPYQGQGANSAIESAAALHNLLYIADENNKLSEILTVDSRGKLNNRPVALGAYESQIHEMTKGHWKRSRDTSGLLHSTGWRRRAVEWGCRFTNFLLPKEQA